MRHMSNREKIGRAAAEARAADEEKVEKKKAAESAPKSPAKKRKKVTSGRMKLVWGIHNSSGRAVKTFEYADKASAEKETARLTRSSGKPHELRATRQPMD
jgi:hypothetical protein